VVNGNDLLNSKDGVSGNGVVAAGLDTDTCTTDATEKPKTGCP
jgi:hypothetical protein